MSSEKILTFKVPGKVVTNGSYIVLNKETASVYTIDKYLHVKASSSTTESFVLRIKGRTEFVCIYDQEFSCPIPSSDSQYFLNIIKTFYKTTKMLPRNSFNFEFSFDEGFYIDSSVKMGIGSSACILVSIVYSLFLFNEAEIFSNNLKLADCPKNLEGPSHTLLSLVYIINKKINPKSSGCDVVACLCGSINFSVKEIVNIVPPCKYLVLGTLGKSTCTRNAISDLSFEDKNWETLTNINREVIDHQQEQDNRSLYKKYLDVLYNISRKIVPDVQYRILRNTFQYEIYGCGISGAGGEDAVWCITNNVDEVVKYWRSEFQYVRVSRIVEKGVVGE